MATDPRIYKRPWRSASDFVRPGRHYLHHARGTVRCWASRVKGELHPTKKRLWGGLSFKYMAASKAEGVKGRSLHSMGSAATAVPTLCAAPLLTTTTVAYPQVQHTVLKLTNNTYFIALWTGI